MRGSVRQALLAAKIPSSFAAFEAMLGVRFEQGTAVAVEPYLGTTRLAVWMQLKRGVWARCRYDVDDATLSMSRRAVNILPTMALYRSTAMTQTGAWNAAATTSTTGSNQRSVGNASIATATAGRKLSQALVPYDAQTYDLFVSVTKRTAGGFLKVSIDGSQALVNEIADPQSLGFKAISCYGAVDNTRRQFVKVASGLTGNHTLEVECVAGVPTGSSAVTTGTVTVEAALITSELQDPRTRPQHWSTGLTIVVGDECEYGGRYYCATTAGTTGVTAPTHTTSTASDGGVTWSAAGLTYASGWIDVRDMDYASEVEAAVATLAFGGQNYDVGGQTHGNEFASGRSIKLDGVEVAWTDASTILFGKRVEITENLSWMTASNGTVLASGQRQTIITPGRFQNDKRLLAAVPFTATAMYGAMLPAVRWDGFWGRSIFTHLYRPDGSSFQFDNFATNVDQALGNVYSAALKGSAGTVGTLAYAVQTTKPSVRSYAASDGNAFAKMNVNALTPPYSGATDWQVKVYFARAQAAVEYVMAGNPLTFQSDHRLGAA